MHAILQPLIRAPAHCICAREQTSPACLFIKHTPCAICSVCGLIQSVFSGSTQVAAVRSAVSAMSVSWLLSEEASNRKNPQTTQPAQDAFQTGNLRTFTSTASQLSSSRALLWNPPAQGSNVLQEDVCGLCSMTHTGQNIRALYLMVLHSLGCILEKIQKSERQQFTKLLRLRPC